MPQTVKTAPARRRRFVYLPMILCWLAYTTAYLGRYSYSANITAIIAAGGYSYAETGLVSTCFFFAYGIGQFVHGMLSKYYNKRVIVPLALFVSALINVAIFCGVPFVAYKYLWLLNGIVQSILWPTLIATIAEKTPDEHFHKASVLMSTSAITGTFLTYGLSALLNWRGIYTISFLVGAVLMLTVAIVWLTGYRRLFPDVETQRSEDTPVRINSERKRLDKGIFSLVVLLCVLAVIDNLINHGLTTWVPSILSEKFALPQSLSILLTLLLPTMGFFGAFSNVLLYARLKNRLTILSLWFGLTVVFIGSVIFFLNTSLWYVVLIALGIVSLSTYGVNIIITSDAPLHMRHKMDSGRLAGILNGCCYLGSTISSYGLGFLADRHGWNGVFYLLIGLCVLCLLITLLGRRLGSASEL